MYPSQSPLKADDAGRLPGVFGERVTLAPISGPVGPGRDGGGPAIVTTIDVLVLWGDSAGLRPVTRVRSDMTIARIPVK